MWWQLFFIWVMFGSPASFVLLFLGIRFSFFSVNHNYVEINKTKEEKIIGLWGNRERWKRQSLYFPFFWWLKMARTGGRWHFRFSSFRFRSKLPRTFEVTVNSILRLVLCRIFSIRRCARCGAGIGSSDLVMRARDLIFHVNCFSCALCGLPLAAGDTAGIRGGRVFCCEHYETELQLWVDLKVFLSLVVISFLFFTVKHQALPFNRFLTSRQQRNKKDDREREKCFKQTKPSSQTLTVLLNIFSLMMGRYV